MEESLEELRDRLLREKPDSLWDWLNENGEGRTSMEILYLVVAHIDQLKVDVN